MDFGEFPGPNIARAPLANPGDVAKSDTPRERSKNLAEPPDQSAAEEESPDEIEMVGEIMTGDFPNRLVELAISASSKPHAGNQKPRSAAVADYRGPCRKCLRGRRRRNQSDLSHRR